ncbi:MAG: hypothetical protein CMD16_02265 [Flavobacteriales bacterium]|nr:hypothetical protein [Flavobacteriales bacterium]|tara:strand:- start:41557 stop:43656 length:2100 start_codon:yes stop_codon:yes gene_type:complete
MATLQKIRNKSWLLLAVIGIAMLAFILGDLFKSTNSSGGNGLYVGNVLGEDVLRQVFEQKVDEGIENWKNQNQTTVLTQTTIGQIRSQIWEQYVRDLVMEEEYAKLGINVSDDEFFELLQGVNVHPEISKVPAFQDPATGRFDRARVLGYLKQIDQDQTGEARSRWIGFQKYLVGLIKTSKYNSLVEESMYTTNEEARINFNSNSQNVTFNYVSIPFSSIDDSEIEPTEREINSYYSNHKLEYQQDPSKDVDFVVFSVVPSLEDDAATKMAITELVSDFETYDDYDLMARRNSDNTESRFVFSSESEMQDDNWVNLFQADEGTVYGPYEVSKGIYRIAKLASVQNRPDSVEARHILIKPTQSMSLDSVNNRIEVLRLAIENGSDFGDLAQKYSEDQGSAIKGGDLGWFSEGVMVDEFNEACFTSKKGSLSVVNSQFGVHLIQVTKTSRKVKKAKIAYIDRIVEPSTETFNSFYNQAAQFAGSILNEGEIFDTLIAKNNLVKRSDNKVTVNKQAIAGLPNSREMVRWMHTAEVGDVSEVFQFDNAYVVAYLKKEYIGEIASLVDIQEQITALVVKEKKAMKISEGISSTDLASIAKENSVSVFKDQKATFANLSIQGIGYEPELVGCVFSTDVGRISKPIIGQNSVFIVEVTSKDESKLSGDFSQQKNQIENQISSYANGASYNALKEAAKVQDNRADFY